MLKAAGHDLATVKREARTKAFRPIDLKATLSADATVDLTRLLAKIDALLARAGNA